jgi:AcrR family transcriptional regulator
MAQAKRSNGEMPCAAICEARAPASLSSDDARVRRSAQALRVGLMSLLETKSFDQITVREICKQAGVHYTTFFRHLRRDQTQDRGRRHLLQRGRDHPLGRRDPDGARRRMAVQRARHMTLESMAPLSGNPIIMLSAMPGT